jgi:hypothetical protein
MQRKLGMKIPTMRLLPQTEANFSANLRPTQELQGSYQRIKARRVELETLNKTLLG